MTSVEEIRNDPLKEVEIAELVESVTGMAILYGVQKKDRSSQEFRVQPVPFTLFPSPIPRKTFEQAKTLQTHFQTLMYRVANDYKFLFSCFERIIPVDDFIRGLWNIYETVRKGNPNQISFMMTRNDYLMECHPYKQDELCLKQVEMNTIAVASGGIMNAMADLHRYTLSITQTPFKSDQFSVENHPTRGLARGICEAWKMYGKPRSVVLFVVDKPEPTQDQRWLERDIFNTNSGVQVIYRKFSQLLQEARYTASKELIVGSKEVAVVYYRVGFLPKHYPTSKEYDIRLTIEMSKAIKCPSVALHLAGCKKVQETLSQPGVLERFIADPTVIADMRKTFVRQTALDQDRMMVEKAKEHPERYVLKPQREGGGNNLFGKDLFSQIDYLYNSPDAPSWILMERIQGYCHKNRLVQAELEPYLREVVSELGIYGVHIGTSEEELVNYECGYLLRTKPKDSDEGGITYGMACLDTVYLTD